jgi:hypothetical protein
MAIAEVPSPKLDAASPQCKGGVDSAAAEPLRGEGGTAGREDAKGARASPPTQLKALWAVSAGVGSIREEGGANGRTVVTHHPGLAPQGVNNLGEALAAICSLASFPPMLGVPCTSFGKRIFRSCLVMCSAILPQSGAAPLLSSERLG